MEMQNMITESICRCCLTNDGKLFSIYDENKTKCLVYMMDQIIRVKPKLDDKLPDKACILCIGNIYHFNNFKLKCDKSNSKLQQLFLNKPIYINMDVKPMNMEKICRCCLRKDGKLFSIYDGGSNTEKGFLAYMVDQMVSVKIKLDDKLPDKACILCISDIQRFYNFKLKCEQSYRKLQQLFSYKIKVELDRPLNIEKTDEFCQDGTNYNSADLYDATSLAYENDTLLPYEVSKNTSISNTDVVSNFATKKESDIAVSPYRCAICKKDHFNNQKLTSHLELHGNPYSSTCDDSALSKQILEHTANNISTPRKQTHKFFSSSRKLESHTKCRYCNKTFAKTYTRKIHERTHTGEKPFKCSYCDKNFARAQTQKDHERIHTGEKPFKCSFCDKMFTRVGSQIRHERTHTGEEQFKCRAILMSLL